MKFTKLLTSAAAIAALTFSAAGAKGIEDIKSESEIFNKIVAQIQSVENSTNDIKFDDIKLGYLRSGVYALIEADDDVGFSSFIEALNILNLPIEELEVSGQIDMNFLTTIINKKAVKCLGVLIQSGKYDFRKNILDLENGNEIAPLKYAKRKNVSNEMLNLLTNAGVR